MSDCVDRSTRRVMVRIPNFETSQGLHIPLTAARKKRRWMPMVGFSVTGAGQGGMKYRALEASLPKDSRTIFLPKIGAFPSGREGRSGWAQTSLRILFRTGISATDAF